MLNLVTLFGWAGRLDSKKFGKPDEAIEFFNMIVYHF
jgi:hypothetical protein